MIDFGEIERNEKLLTHFLNIKFTYKNLNYKEHLEIYEDFIQDAPQESIRLPPEEYSGMELGVFLLNLMSKYGDNYILDKVKSEFAMGKKFSEYVYSISNEVLNHPPELRMFENEPETFRQKVFNNSFDCKLLIVGLVYLKNREVFEPSLIELELIKKELIQNKYKPQNGNLSFLSIVSPLIYFIC